MTALEYTSSSLALNMLRQIGIPLKVRNRLDSIAWYRFWRVETVHDDDDYGGGLQEGDTRRVLRACLAAKRQQQQQQPFGYVYRVYPLTRVHYQFSGWHK
ncbi:hypothetical protein KPH14_005913 [Odynerus spinipes]|uniref:Uncharacterized protein n=1 Tax=Odynerus spinipes TaxID=1348599 RepID=A0AAD9VN25_9HYME|nr:hypothetical protein KPH14_005913 [Odynerus spinipes]